MLARLLPFMLLLLAPLAHAQTRTLVCPIDGTRVTQGGGDGQPSPRMYSDFEVPTEAYANRIMACPSCGYAQWVVDFDRFPDANVAAYVQQNLKKDAKRVVEPKIAWQHFAELLRARHAPIREQITGLLDYTYVLKRSRPPGGQDYALEQQIKTLRAEVLNLLFLSLRDDPPKSERARLEWLYLGGELTRLTGDPKRALPLLKDVCELREHAGNLVGALACEMAERARRGETFEDYQGGMVDGAQARPPQVVMLPTAPSPTVKVAILPPVTPEKLAPMQREAPPREATGNAPPPPPIPK